jgi:hypothetical protein
MQIRNTLLAAVIVGGSILAVAGDANAAAWTSASGSTSTFTYSGGKDSNGLFGSPTQVNNNGFFFQPNNFIATSTNNSAALTTDTLSVNVSSANGQKNITRVALDEAGDYSIDNGGGVKDSGGLFVRVLDANYPFATRVYSATLTTNPTMPVNSAGDAGGIFTGLVVVNLPAPAAMISIVFNNTLQAHSNVGGSSFIQKKFIGDSDGDGAGLTIYQGNVVPEPTSIAAILGGLGFIAARRRKA